MKRAFVLTEGFDYDEWHGAWNFLAGAIQGAENIVGKPIEFRGGCDNTWYGSHGERDFHITQLPYHEWDE